MNTLSRRSFTALCSSFLVHARARFWASARGLDAVACVPPRLGNVALHRAAYQSGSADDDHTAHLVTDGSQETYWESEPGTEAWLALDLGEPLALYGVTLDWGAVYATSFRLQIAGDGLFPREWNDVAACSSATGGVQTFSLAQTKARQVRVLIAATSHPGRGCMLKELVVQGVCGAAFALPAQPAASADGSLALTGGNWKLQSAGFVAAPPELISRAGFNDAEWLPAQVPGTVLGSYLKLGAIPDPWFGDQMSQISEAFFSHNDFWYRNHVVVPSAYAGKRIWLHFEGISWKAEVYVNGSEVGRIDGSFLRGRFEITRFVQAGQTACLAVLLRKVAHAEHGPKKVLHKRLGSPTTNGDLLGFDSPAFLASAGWNWLPIVRGREIGIWSEVRLETSGPVTIVDPWIETVLADRKQAELTLRLELCNHSSAQQQGKLVGKIGKLSFERVVTIPGDATLAVCCSKNDCPELVLAEPRLWWPNGYGDQPLYELVLRFEANGAMSDSRVIPFGIRTLESKVVENVLTVFVNGTRILLRGGNWGMAEGMLRCDAAGLALRVRLHRDAHLTMIRNWIGMEGHQAFYDACDRYGILVWDDFWLANPVDGPDPADQAMFMANVEDKIRRVRSHASLAFYCGRNEGFAPPGLDAAMQAAVQSLDGTRHYIPDSAAGTVSGLGPYDVKDAAWYFANRGRDLHSEQGVVAIPTVESMRAMMPADCLWPINDMWAVHDYQEPRSRLYTEKLAERYGVSTSIEDYCLKAQLMNLESTKAMYECLQANQGSGMLLWMTQAAWPSLICQLYDHYFEMTGAYFGAKTGCQPLHILWNADLDTIQVANSGSVEQSNLTAEARSFDFNSKEVWQSSAELDLDAATAHTCFAFPRAAGSTSIFFLHLRLRRGSRTLSENFYWDCAPGGSCRDLVHLPPAPLEASAEAIGTGGTIEVKVSLRNPTPGIALAIRLRVQRARSGQRVLPVFFEDNFFSLLPGAGRIVALEFSATALAGEAASLIVEGWNTPAQVIALA